MHKTVSIVIPCRNEEKYISRCLDSIIKSDFPKNDLEIFVCDGKSDDNTIKEIQKYHYPFIRLLVNQHQTTPFALNLGIRSSNSDVVIILGAHAEIYPDFINKCLEVLNSEEIIGCAGGIIENVNENEETSIIALAMSSSFGVGNAHFRTGNKKGYVDTVAFGAYKREVFNKIGFFDEELTRNQDDEFNYRLLKSGYKIYLSPEIKSRYFVRSSYKKLFKQYYQYGYWKVYVNVKHHTITTSRQFIPALFVLFLVGFGIISFISLFARWAFIFVLLLYLTGAFYSALQKTKNISKAGRMGYVFFILHLSYGLGYLEGILDFVILRKKISNKKAMLNR